MKKVISLILAVVMVGMLFSVDPIANAAKAKKEPFYAVNFQDISVESEYLYKFVEIYTPMLTSTTDTRVPSYGDAINIDVIAEMIKEEMDSRPEGTRFINFEMLRSLTVFAENVINLDVPIEKTKEWFTDFLKSYSRIGGKLDGILVDWEYRAARSDMIYEAYKAGDTTIYDDIAGDARYIETIRPELEKRGFVFCSDNTKSEIWGINVDAATSNSDYALCRTIWDNVINDFLAEAINEAIFAPLMRYYPDASLSDYQKGDFKGWYKHLNDDGTVRYGNRVKAGNTSNYNIYSNRVGNNVYTNYKNIPGYNGALYGSDPFYMTLWDTNLYKTMLSATDTDRISAWIGGYTGYWAYEGGKDPTCTSANTPYYTETFFHVALMNMDPLITYITKGAEGEDYNTCLSIVSDILAEMTRVAGYADRKPISTPANWNGNYVLSGMYAGGRNIWRLTPNTAVKSREAFLVDEETPTFSIDGLTITFPGGKIIDENATDGIETYGYWIETASDITPVITSEADRYSKYPSFMDDFSAGSLNSGYWTTTKPFLGGTNPSVQNGALALTNNSNYTATTADNVNLPKNITAGDSYAKQQAWEVTFTLPSGIGTSAEMKFLTANGDGGFRINGRTAYYDQNGTYQEMSIGQLSTDVKYTIKRELDFEAFTNSYYLYDNNGNLLDQVTNVPMQNISLPVTTIGFSAKAISGKTLLIDDYKLYPMGVTTDFEVYDVELGYKQDATQVRTEDTAYRLSWMNTTNENLFTYIKNAQTGETVKAVYMPAGQDGVITGIEEADGNGIQLYVTEPQPITAAELDGTPWIAFGSAETWKTPIEGGNAVYFTTSEAGVVTEGGSEENYNIKVTYPLGGKPTIVLNNATIVSDYAGICYGSSYYHDYPAVDIVVRGNNTITTSDGRSAIQSLTNADVTIKSEGNGRLNVYSELLKRIDTMAAITSQGNILLDNANIFMQGTGATGETESFIYSENGDITLSGGSLQIAAGGAALPVSGDYPVLCAKNGDIILDNAAKLTVWNTGANSVFATNSVVVKKVAMNIAAPNANGRIADSQTKFVFPHYNSITSTKIPTATFDVEKGVVITPPEKVSGYDKAESDNYKYFSISPS